MTLKFFNRFTTGLLLFALAAIWGCGTGDYERLIDARTKKAKSESKFSADLNPMIDVPASALSLCIPKKFANTPLVKGATIDGKPVDPRRVENPLINIPEWKATYEGFQEKDGKKLPFYLYIYVIAGKNPETLMSSIKTELIPKFPNVSGPSDFSAQTAEGNSVTWKKVTASGKQDFYVAPAQGDGQFQSLDGSVEIFFHTENNILVILFWRTPLGLDDMKNVMDMTAGSVTVKGAD
jgi:hypothetical protein